MNLAPFVALLRQICNILIVLGCIVAGTFAGMFGDAVFGLAGVPVHSGFMYFGEIVGLAIGVRLCWLRAPAKKPGA